MHSRRTALIQLATAATSAALSPLLADTPEAEHHRHEMFEQTAAPVASAGPSYFSQADYETVSQLADLIIPRTETPGAIDAGVPHWIDQQVALKPELQEQFKQGLAQLNEQAPFTSLTEQQRIALLENFSTDPTKSAFFKTVKDLTIDTYYKTEAGLVQELGFHGNTFRTSFPGCTHPEHWPTTDTTPEHAQ